MITINSTVRTLLRATTSFKKKTLNRRNGFGKFDCEKEAKKMNRELLNGKNVTYKRINEFVRECGIDILSKFPIIYDAHIMQSNQLKSYSSDERNLDNNQFNSSNLEEKLYINY